MLGTWMARAAWVIASGCAFARGPDGLVVFAFDQQVDMIFRFEDKNGDGDFHDVDEVKIFFTGAVPVTGTTNSQGLLALSPTELYATDNFAPDDVVRLVDLDGDGDALDSGESSRWFEGVTPAGSTITNPVSLAPGPNGWFTLVDNNVLDTTVPSAVYLVKDVDGDGDANDPGEVVNHFTLSPAGASGAAVFDGVFDSAGACYVFDIADPGQIEHIDRVDPSASSRVQWLRSTTLLNLTGFIFGSSFKLEHNPATDEIIASSRDLSDRIRLIALKDRNGSGFIDAPNEVRLLWTETLNADGVTCGTTRDFVLCADGSLVFIDSGEDQVVRLIDLSGDGDYNDLGESRIMYKVSLAPPGTPIAPTMLSVAAAFPAPAPPCPADLDGDGQVGASDLAGLLGSWGGPGPADLDGDGAVGASDLATLLGSWGSCPAR